MPSFFNDPIVIEALKKLEVSEERARDWSVVGCYEAAPQGDACPMTVAGGISLPDIFLDYFSESEAEDFDSFFSDFKNYFNRRYIKKLSEFQSNWDRMSVDKASPFESVCLTGCIESGKAAEAGGAKYNFYGVNVLGIGTLVDSLLAVREIVYETRKLSLAEFKKEVRENFPDKKLLNLCRNMPGKYGSGQGLSNLIAGDISRHIVRTILFRPLENGVRPYPGFFWFGRDIHALIPATPDGRRDNELISYGAGPGLLCSEGDISSILRSVAELPNDFCACGNPLILSFNRKDISGEEGAERLKQVIKTYFSAGGFHLHINITDAEQLRKIQQDDSEQPDLTVRISGYSAKFSGIDRKWQDAVIERTEKGM
jgi:formate C-acetyltransferase